MSPPLRIAMLGPFGLQPKGTMGARALPAARALARRGHEVALIMPAWHPPRPAPRVWVADGVRLEYVDLAGLGVPALGHVAVAARMARAAARCRPDVVHVFKPKAYGALAADILRVWPVGGRRPPVVIDTDDWEGPGGWNELEPYSRAQRAFFAWQERRGLGGADRVTVASRGLETLAWALGVRPERVMYLPNAVDELPVEQWREGSGPGRVLLYTRFFEFESLRPLTVLSAVREHVPGAQLDVVGAGLFGEETEFQSLARRQGHEQSVRMLGWLEGKGLAEGISQASVAIYPMDDNLVNRTKAPRKLLDLMATGVPVVADAVGEAARYIEHEVSGVLVPPGDTGAMALAVARVLTEPGLAQRLSDGARRRVAAHYTWEVLAPALEQAYEAAVGAAASVGARYNSG